MFVKVIAGAVVGIEAVRVTVEANMCDSGIGLYLVGLPDNAVKESHERIASAFSHLSLIMPYKKLVINLAPADLRKEGASFDLPIAIGILAASGQIESRDLDETMILGEISLDGSLRPIKGALSLAMLAREMGLKQILLPTESAHEASVVEGIEVLAAESLSQVVNHFNNLDKIEPIPHPIIDMQSDDDMDLMAEDFADVKGQRQVKRAFEIAAAGGHNIIMIGPPGSGKTMLSKRLPSILPPMRLEEALETTKIYSVAGKLGVTKEGLMRERPFRAPHNITSQVAIIGGGSTPQPGEISLANNGILFLDELPEFGRSILEVLRQPLEEREITISRARYSVRYPANFTLVAAMNPCPCGYYNHPTKECSCGTGAVQRYLGRISGPLMDRIDLHIEVAPVSITQIHQEREEERSAMIRKRVVAARSRQHQRLEHAYPNSDIRTNAMMTSRMLREICPLDEAARRMLEIAIDKLKLSVRAYDRIIKVARTIADLAGEDKIETTHIAEAISYRSLDRENWGTTPSANKRY